MSRSVMIVAGGTGGHVYPGLAVADALGDAGIELHWLGTRRGLEARIVPEHGVDFATIPVAGLRRSGILRWLSAPIMVALALLCAVAAIVRTRPQVVLGMGGFVSGPGGLAAWLCRRPLVIHEQNAIPGLTNRILAKFATRVLQAFPQTFSPTLSPTVTGNPVRRAISGLAHPRQRMRARNELRVLVFGGSRGARALNQAVPAALIESGIGTLHVVHQCGPHDVVETRQRYLQGLDPANVEVSAYIEDMAEVYATADLVVARAGALTIAEIAAAGVASILVPYPYAVDDHQTANAAYLVDAGAAIVVPEHELADHHLAALLADLLNDRQRLLAMAISARNLAQADATDAVARSCLELVDA